MIKDIEVLKLLCNKDNYENYIQHINQDNLCKETKLLCQDLAAYYDKYGHNEVNWQDFSTFFFHLRNPEMNPELRENYSILLRTLEQYEPSETSSRLLMEKYRTQELLLKIHALMSPEEIQKELERHFSKENKELDKLPFISLDLQLSLSKTDLESGYKWRLNEMNSLVGTLMPGTFGIIAAASDSGKTGFLISEMSYVLQQLSDNECVLWCNNEGLGDENVPRLYSATLNATRKEIEINNSAAELKFQELCGDKLKMLDVHGFSYKRIEHIIKELRPRVVVLDMLDHIQGSKPEKSALSTDKYEELYQWARQTSVTYKCTILGTSQTSAVPENYGRPDAFLAKYPNQCSLKGSHASAKQGGANWICMIGIDPYAEVGCKSRYLHAPKSKRGNKELKVEVEFDNEKSLFHSPQSPFRTYK